jgi:hypothetical protein
MVAFRTRAVRSTICSMFARQLESCTPLKADRIYLPPRRSLARKSTPLLDSTSTSRFQHLKFNFRLSSAPPLPPARRRGSRPGSANRHREWDWHWRVQPGRECCSDSAFLCEPVVTVDNLFSGFAHLIRSTANTRPPHQ